MKSFYTIEKEERSELIEKKSKFIATTYKVQSVKEAEEKIREIKKKYHDARHNCYAYRIIENKNIIEKSSDDGEPSGTAGSPILNILQQIKLCNILVIVTRYFGGILLGTGGLVRAYSQSTKQVILESKIQEVQEGYEVEIELKYKDLKTAKYFFETENIEIISIKYLENVTIKIEITEKQKMKLEKAENLKFKPLKLRIIKEKYI